MVLVDQGLLSELVEYINVNGGWRVSGILRLMKDVKRYRMNGAVMREMVIDKINDLYYLVIRFYAPNGIIDKVESCFFACDDVKYLYRMYCDMR